MAANREAVRQSLLTVALLVGVWLTWMLREIVVLIGFAALIAYALDPVVSLVERIPLPRRKSVPRGVAAGIVMLGLVSIGVWALTAAVPQLSNQIGRFTEAAPAALERLDNEVQRFVEARGWQGMPFATSGVVAPLLRAAQQSSGALLGSLFGNLSHLVGLLLLPILAFYLVVDRMAVSASALELIPEDMRPQAERVLKAIAPAMRAYVRGQSLVCLVMGLVMAVILRMLGFPVAMLLGVIIGLAEIVPYLGFGIAAIAVALAGYSVSPTLALAGVGAYIVANNVLGALVSPRLLGREIKLHAFVVTVSILAGGALLGPAGGILAVPAVAIVQSLIAEFAPRAKRAKAA